MINQTYRSSIFLAITVALGGFIFGFDASVISGVIGFVTAEFQLSVWQQGFVVSSPTLGAAIGMLIAGPCADAFGRKKVLIFIAALYTISAVFSALAPNYETLVAARMIGGFAFASLVIAPMYIAEISAPALRGKMISINQFNIVIGLSAAYFTNYFLLQLSSSTTGIAESLGNENIWRWMLGLEIVPAACYLLLLFTIPESPRWLACNNKEAEAKPILARLFPESNIEQLISEIKQDIQGNAPSFLHRAKELFSKKMLLILVVGLIIAAVQQATGINSIFFYAPVIFEQSGVGQDAAFSQAIWVGVINVTFTIVAMVLVDKLGRKPLLIFGLSGIFISMCIISYGFSQATYKLTNESISVIENAEVKNKIQPILGTEFDTDLKFKAAINDIFGKQEANKHFPVLLQASAKMNASLILFGILGFIACFAFSLGPVMWVILAEIFPNHLRGVGIAITGLVNAGVSFSVQLIFPWELAHFGNALTFFLYGVSAIIGLGLLLWLLPETKGKSLEEIEQIFERKT